LLKSININIIVSKLMNLNKNTFLNQYTLKILQINKFLIKKYYIYKKFVMGVGNIFIGTLVLIFAIAIIIELKQRFF
jgi:hypothetical protein